MSTPNILPPRILIVGAGAMGMIMGYMLDRAGAAITYLVRPHRLKALGRPQMLYSYDDNRLASYSNYDCISDPGDIAGRHYDYVLIALDGSALRSSEGEALTRAIGHALRATATHVIVGTIGIGLKSYFVRMSGLSETQVSSGALAIMVHPVKDVELPLHPPTDPDLLRQADLAYRHGNAYGFAIDDSAADQARRFVDIYNESGVSRCVMMAAHDLAATIPALFPVFAASELIGWPKAQELGRDAELWDLTTRAVQEVQGLDANGDAGQMAARTTTGESLMAMFTDWETETLPLDLAAFNRFHHGGKVNLQDRQLLQDCVDVGESEGKSMTALKELLTLRAR